METGYAQKMDVPQSENVGFCRPTALTLPGLPIRLSASSIALLTCCCGLFWTAVSAFLIEHTFISGHTPLYLLSGALFSAAAALVLQRLLLKFAGDLACTRSLVHRVFEAAPESIAVVRDQDGAILLANQQLSSLIGEPGADLNGKTINEVAQWENREEQLEIMRLLHSQGEVRHFETSFSNRGGRALPVALTARKINFDRQPCTIVFAEDISHQQEISRQVEELTLFDPLTGLPNHKLLLERLEQLVVTAARDEQGFAVLLLAMNRCPCAIRMSGHDACDLLMREVAGRLRDTLRQSDTLAVLQKGEFGILLPKTSSERELLPVLGKLIERIGEPIAVADSEYQLHAHIGIALFPGDGRSSEVLLQHAELALLQAQTNPVLAESRFRFYAEEMNKAADEQLQIESSILRGIKNGEFFANYQPLFSQDGIRIIGMEALARWNHPTLGLVGPDKFIPVAEANGAIVQLGEWILELALQNCKVWREQINPDLVVSVNVSTRQLKDRRFAERVSHLLQTVGLPPHALCCELTESLLMEHSNENTAQLFRLKELGVRLAIDDFGTGYSSLTYLKHLPVDYLKIDRSFIQDIDSNSDDRAIVAAIIAMARSLNLKVVAEGVETPAQHHLLQELGCDSLQGYLFGRPMERSSFEQFLHSKPAPSGSSTEPSSAYPQSDHPTADRQRCADPAQPEERMLQTVADLTLLIPPLKPADRLNTALDRFQTDKLLQVLPVVEQQKVVGVLNRSEFIEEQVVGRIGYAFHINHSKKVRDLMQPVPLVIESDTSIEDAAQALHGRFGTMRLENICVSNHGEYLGVLDVRTLVEAITALNLKLAKGANPLTGLPGNESIQREITRRLDSGLPFEIAYIDIDNFKPFNDYYGFERGDMVIQIVGDIILHQSQGGSSYAAMNSFCGHIGGDDFILISSPGDAVPLCCQIIRDFELRLPVLHGPGDCTRGCYTAFNRKGELETFSLLSLSMAVISTAHLPVSSYPHLASMASEVKKSAKKVKGSSVVLKDSDEQPRALFSHMQRPSTTINHEDQRHAERSHVISLPH